MKGSVLGTDWEGVGIADKMVVHGEHFNLFHRGSFSGENETRLTDMYDMSNVEEEENQYMFSFFFDSKSVPCRINLRQRYCF